MNTYCTTACAPLLLVSGLFIYPISSPRLLPPGPQPPKALSASSETLLVLSEALPLAQGLSGSTESLTAFSKLLLLRPSQHLQRPSMSILRSTFCWEAIQTTMSLSPTGISDFFSTSTSTFTGISLYLTGCTQYRFPSMMNKFESLETSFHCLSIV